MNCKFQVFLSFKNSDENNNPTKECKIASALYNFLSSNGLKVFYSNVSLEEYGIFAFKKAIDYALDNAQFLVAIGTTVENLNSKWVKYEWDTFHNEIISGNKPGGRIFVLIDNIIQNQLPIALRQVQIFTNTPEEFQKIFNFISNSIDKNTIKTKKLETKNYKQFQYQPKMNKKLEAYIRDFDRYINEKTHNFVGRQFVFDAIKSFTKKQTRGYFFIRGEPGIGKSALIAQLVKNKRYFHHFNIRSEGINTASIFIKNICAQMIISYDLNYEDLPANATQDSGFLNTILDEASKKNPNEKLIITIDALDEVDKIERYQEANPLFLPVILPQNVYIIVTMRKDPIHIRIDCEQHILDIEQDSEGNIKDIKQFIILSMNREGIKKYIIRNKINNKIFLKYMLEKSQGNFMYLKYVLPEIANGFYVDLSIDKLPFGLMNYYDNHWQRMQGLNENAWFKYKLPIIKALTVTKLPINIDLISDFSGVKEKDRIRLVLEEWKQFLYEEKDVSQPFLKKRYRIYHASFHDFISKKELLDDVEKDIVDNLMLEIFDEQQSYL